MCRSVIAEISDLNQQLVDLLDDEDAAPHLGPPCTPAQIDAVRREFARFVQGIPPSYLEFLELHDGWTGILGDIRMLTVTERSATWMLDIAQATLEWLDDDDPFASMVAIEADPSTGSYLAVLDPRTARESGEMDVVVYVHFEVEMRVGSFLDYLADRAEMLRQVIDDQLNGDLES